jgi:hypothetical protein
MKTIDTREYFSAIRELVRQGREVSVPVSGNSMSPFLVHQRDTVWFRAPDSPIRRGDMVVFQRPTGDFVMHRVLRTAPEGCYIVGDAQTCVEGPVARERIFARVTCVQRKGREIDERDFWWRFFAGPWLTLRPLRPAILRGYTLLTRKVSNTGAENEC